MNSSILSSKDNIVKYTVRIVIFLLFLFLFDRLLYVGLYNFQYDFNSRSHFEERFGQFVKEKNYNTLILGTSRTYEGIHPYYINMFLGQKAYKDAFQGKGPKYFYYFYQMYKKYAGVPKVVIYGVDYFIFNIESTVEQMARFDFLDRPKVNYFSSPLLLLEHKKSLDAFQNSFLLRLNEKQDENETKELFKDLKDHQDYVGVNFPSKNIKTKEPADYVHQHFPRPPGAEGEYLFKLLDELDRDRVAIVLVALPDHIGTRKTNFQFDTFLNYMKSLRKKYKTLEVLNFNRIDRFPLDNIVLFNDGGYGMTNSHMSKYGAQYLNRLLCDYIAHHYN